MKSSGFVCEGTSDPSVCAGLPPYKNWQSHQLCVLHFPGKKSLKLFEDCADAKLDRDDFNFDGVWFPGELLLDFEDREFASDVVFSNCTFNGEVSFRKCVFHKKAKFSGVEFKAEVNVEFCEFREEADFSRSSFEGYTEFSGSDFKSSVT
jgi:Pentapeptide repeats (9 copies)